MKPTKLTINGEIFTRVQNQDSSPEYTNEDETETYLVYTDSQADLKAEDKIRESLWAFRSEFIYKYSDVDIQVKYIRQMQEEMCESCNEIIYGLIKSNFKDLVYDAIDSDGRGHFISWYDGKEIELENDLYAYRV